MPTVAGRRYSYQRAAVSDFRDDCRLGYLEKRANRISSTESRPTIVPAKISSVGQRSAEPQVYVTLSYRSILAVG
jgi:hypothetical protein